jgi:hypothetical protein
MCVALTLSCNEKRIPSDGTVKFEKTEALSVDSTYGALVTTLDCSADTPEYLQDSIARYTRLLLASWFSLSDGQDLFAAVAKHKTEYLKMVKDNNLPNINAFRLKIVPEESYQTKDIVSIGYNWDLYEGGAHGNFGKYCFTIIKKDGHKASWDELVGNKKEFLATAEAEFRKQSGIGENERFYDIYRFKDNTFHVNNNFLFDSEGVTFFYNPYEIAPYSAGLIELRLPYSAYDDYTVKVTR